MVKNEKNVDRLGEQHFPILTTRSRTVAQFFCTQINNSLDKQEEELEGIPNCDEYHKVVEGIDRKLECLHLHLHAIEIHFGWLLVRVHVGIGWDVGVLRRWHLGSCIL